MTIACPRHGVQPLARDTPCPTCASLLYDLDDREALKTVRAARTQALKGRRTAILLGLAAIGVVAGQVFSFDDGGFHVDVVRLMLVWVGASLAMVPLGTAVERVPALRALDAALKARKKR